jgi:tetratricopeptide (TPR) repeat protein
MTFDAFLKTAWNDHAERTDEVADRLSASLPLVTAPENIAPFARLTTHVFGEHLGQWQRGIALLEALRGLPAYAGSAAAAGAVATSIATLRYVGGDASALRSLAHEDRVAALATASAACAGRGDFRQAITTYETALREARDGLPAGSAAHRALAIGGNNLACELEQKADRDGNETRGMVIGAEGALEFWKLAGTWLEEERAEYRLTRSLLKARQPAPAIASAERCVAVCRANDAPPFEQFFAYAVLALARRAAGEHEAAAAAQSLAWQMYAQVPEDERQWCADDLAELDAQEPVAAAAARAS